MTYTYYCVCSARLLMMGPKYVEFYSQNKFEKLVHLVGFIIRSVKCCWGSAIRTGSLNIEHSGLSVGLSN